MELCLCVDTSWSQKSVDRSLLGYDTEVDPMLFDSEDEDDDDTGMMTAASPRAVRQAESLQGPYSLLSLPLPSDALDSTRRGSDHSSPSPGRSPASAAVSRSIKSLDQRLDELFAGGKLGDGISPPSSVSDRPSDVESDSLSEDELDIIKLRKPVTVTLQPATSSMAQSPTELPKAFDQKFDDKKDDRVIPPPAAVGAAPLTDDMVDQIVRLKPMLAKAARRPSVPNAAASNPPDDFSPKALHHSAPVDLSSKPYAFEIVTSVSEKATFVSEKPVSVSISQTTSTLSTTCISAAAVSTATGSSLTHTSSLPVSLTLKSLSSLRPTDPRRRLNALTESQSASSLDDVQSIQSKWTNKSAMGSVSTLESPTSMPVTDKRPSETTSTLVLPPVAVTDKRPNQTVGTLRPLSVMSVTDRKLTETTGALVSPSLIAVTDKRLTETTSTLMSPFPALSHMSFVTSVQKSDTSSVTTSLTQSADIANASSCQQTASDQNFQPSVLDSISATSAAASRYH